MTWIEHLLGVLACIFCFLIPLGFLGIGVILAVPRSIDSEE